MPVSRLQPAVCLLSLAHLTLTTLVHFCSPSPRPVPDFRSPETGLYANLAALDLPEPEAVFELSFFRQNPSPFYALAKELYPGRYHPTVSHVFIRLLADKGLLHELFTQNIDCLERAAGIPAERIVEAHGSFATQRCIECKAPFDDALMREHVRRGEVPRCSRARKSEDGGEGGGQGGRCDGLVKPDIVFFGEALPRAFFERNRKAAEADLVLVMGTSLQVHPFASLPNLAGEGVPRVLFNLERVGTLGTQADDVLVLGDCDAGVRKLADELGWRDELEAKWRELVGEEEAQRQLQGGKQRAAVLHDEVSKLADEVEEVLHLQDKEAEESKSTTRHDQDAVEEAGDNVLPSTSQKAGQEAGPRGPDEPQPDGPKKPVEAKKEDIVESEEKENTAGSAGKAAL